MPAVQAAIASNAQTATGANLDVAGESVRKLITKMDKYILPPEFDFIRNPETTPIVMYIFEFSHKFDQNDYCHTNNCNYSNKHECELTHPIILTSFINFMNFIISHFSIL